MPKDPRIKKVLVIGSGPIIIGQAAEFDYSGTQACRALKAEGIETVLLNSNPATIMTDPDVADHVYIEPMTLEVVERILDIEKPDSVLPNLGGQMGLNLSMELARSGYLDRSGIRLLACKPETIDRAEDRELFKETMEKLHQPIIPSEVVETLQDALACADRIGYPVIVRPAFTMGGTKNGLLFGEALVITNDSLKPHFRNMIKQRGGMFAKGFLFGTQFKAYFEDDLWLTMARHAVTQAQRIQKAAAEKGYSLYAVSPTNQVFLVLSHAQIERLKQNFAFELNGRVDEDHEAARFVCSWATKPEAVDALIAAL